MPKIAFFDTKPYDKEFFDRENQEYGYEIKYFKNRLNPDTAILAKGYDVVCAFVNDDLGKETLDILDDHGTKMIAMRCAGYNNVDMKSAYKRIHIARVPAYSPHAVAEHALALMLTLNRKTHKAYYRTRDGNFTISGFMGFDLSGKTAGVIGTGKIGKIMAEILLGLNMHVLLYDVYPDQEYAKQKGMEYVELDDLYKRSDIITLHCPLTKDTFHMINEESIEKMKNKVMIINTSRGHIIDTSALVEALKNKKVGSAGLDVYEEESEYFFEDLSNTIIEDDVLARLLSFNNVLVTSHQGFFTEEAVTNIAKTTFFNISQFEKGVQMDNEICYQCGAEPCPRDQGGKCTSYENGK